MCAPGTSLIGRNRNTCSARYSFKICDALAGCVDFDDAVKRYRCGVINDECMRAVHFLRDLIDNRDYYGRCLFTRDELCNIIKFVTAVCDSCVLTCILVCFILILFLYFTVVFNFFFIFLCSVFYYCICTSCTMT